MGLTGNVEEREVQIHALKGLNLSHLHPWPVSNLPGYSCSVKLYFSYFLLSSLYFVAVFWVFFKLCDDAEKSLAWVNKCVI